MLHKLGRDHEARSHATHALRNVAHLAPDTQDRVAVASILAGWLEDDDEAGVER
jgi:hypothetical protein